MSSTFKTSAGDTFEAIARIVYGTELEALRLRDANPGAIKASGIEKLRVVAVDLRTLLGPRVSRILAGDSAERRDGVGYTTGHGPGRVLGRGDGNDARASPQADRRLDADERAG